MLSSRKAGQLSIPSYTFSTKEGREALFAEWRESRLTDAIGYFTQSKHIQVSNMPHI